MDIESVAEHTPEKITREFVDPLLGLQAFQARKIAQGLGFGGALNKPASEVILNLYKLFLACDCSMVEVNPLVLTPDNRVLALDAKFNFDDNALYRHKDIAAMRDETEEDPREVAASKFGLNYIGLGRRHRLPGQRRGPGDGDDGHHQISRRQPGQLLRRGGWRERAAGHGGVQKS